jgi:hypothetical protein
MKIQSQCCGGSELGEKKMHWVMEIDIHQKVLRREQRRSRAKGPNVSWPSSNKRGAIIKLAFRDIIVRGKSFKLHSDVPPKDTSTEWSCKKRRYEEGGNEKKVK